MPPFTYAQFHALFLVPPLFVLSAATLWGRRRSVVSPLAVGIITVVALVYTTPWDNYLIIRGVWGYGEGAVTAVIWEAPVEEYAFILLQPLLGAMWLHLYSLTVERPADDLVVTWRDRALGALAALPVLVVGLVMLAVDATFYMGAILAWGAPVLALQWAVGWKHLLARARLVVVGVVVPTLYLSAADRIAIENGIWFLSDRYTTGLTVAGLPIEEGAFFLITTLFVVQGLVLYPWVIERWR